MQTPRSTLLPWLLALAALSCDREPDASTTKATPPRTGPSDPDKAPMTPPSPTEPTAPATKDPAPPVEDAAPLPAAAPAQVAAVASGFNRFGFELYAKIREQPGDQVISPASIALALSMTHAGAKGATADEIASALHFPGPTDEVQAAVATMLGDMATPHEDLELAVANRLFGEATVPFHPAYVVNSRRIFGAPLEALDFMNAPEPSRVRINDWVATQTHDRIKDLIPPGSVNPSIRLVLVNALYFKGSWIHPFREHLTAPAPFHAAAGAHDVPTMHVTDNFAVSKGDGFELIELPYEGPGYAMTIVLPDAPDGLAAVEAKLDGDGWARWTSGLLGERIALSMPKFRVAPGESLRLGGVLGQLGIRTAFDASADFTGMAPSDAQIMLSEVFHKGFIEVDEKGTEAAAATAVMARAGGMPPKTEPREVKIDRPFLYVIRDTRTGLVLFMGRVLDPKTA